MGDTKKTHWIKPQCDKFDLDDDGRSVAEIKDFIMSLDPKGADTAASAYQDAATRLATTLDAIDEVSGELAKIWEGDSSVKAQKALKLLHETVRNLSDGLQRMGKPLNQLADKIREHQDFVENTMFAWSDQPTNVFGKPITWDDSAWGAYKTIDKGWETGSQDELAGQHLRALTNDLYHIYVQFPDSVQKNLPDIKDPSPPDPKDTKDNFDPRDLLKQHPYNPGGNGDLDLNGPDSPDGGGLDRPEFPGGDTGLDGTGGDGTGRDGTGADGTGQNGTGTGGVGNGAGIDGSRVGDRTGADTSTASAPNIPDPSRTGVGDSPNGNDSRSTNLSDFNTPTHDGSPSPTASPTSHSSTNGTSNGTSSGGTTGVSGAVAAPAQGASTVRTGNAAGGMGVPVVPHGGGHGGNEERTSEMFSWLKEEDDVWTGPLDGVVNGHIG
ncbi:WXG100 family type VII secretion target [Nonomuraea sp. NPDC000554]|uniref:WXG100 family type VII secretion target n=1 Tax=Nonomuraea sp. NPDC000554 TaxID=3154259 RepID=UPI003329A29C